MTMIERQKKKGPAYKRDREDGITRGGERWKGEWRREEPMRGGTRARELESDDTMTTDWCQDERDPSAKLMEITDDEKCRTLTKTSADLARRGYQMPWNEGEGKRPLFV